MYGLPHEAKDVPLTYDELIVHLRAIAASGVSVQAQVGAASDTDWPFLTLRGALTPGKSDGAFAVGERNSREGGGGLRVPRDDFAGARLSTYDGDDYFWLSIRLRDVTIALADTNSI